MHENIYEVFCIVSSDSTKKIVTAAQLRAARGLLGWSQADLAKASMVSRPTIDSIERGVREPHDRTLADIILAVLEAGVVFLSESDGGGRGVRFGKPEGEKGMDPQERRVIFEAMRDFVAERLKR
jgi:transcriptional regulator with XRE-family HTH domain